MRNRIGILVAVAGVLLFGMAAAANALVTVSRAIRVPGTAALNNGGKAVVESVSCASAGNCAAGGFYTDGAKHTQAFVADRVNGTWRPALEVPGTAALNGGGNAVVASVSCASAGNCAAGGSYRDKSGKFQAFVASEVKGIWHAAIEVRGPTALSRGGRTAVASVSCASAGNCSAGGSYLGPKNFQVFVADEVHGTWHAAIEIPGTAALNAKGWAAVNSMSCASAGNCVVGGWYSDASYSKQAFVADEVDGTWHAAIEIPGTAALNAKGFAEVTSVSCASAGNCAVGGFYWADPDNFETFVADEVNGTWQSAVESPGIGQLNVGGLAAINSVSCASAGNCAVGGYYTSGTFNHRQAFVADEVNGSWQTAIEVPGTLNVDHFAGVMSVSCASAGNCTAGGAYRVRRDVHEAFVVVEVNGTWQAAVEVPGTAGLNAGGDAGVKSLSCPSVSSCVAAGFYRDASGHTQPFVTGH